MGILLEKAVEFEVALTEEEVAVVEKLEVAIEEHKESVIINSNSAPAYFPKDRYDTVNAKLSTVTSELEVAKAQLAEVTPQIEELNRMKLEHELLVVELQNSKLQFKAEAAAIKYRARDYNDIKPYIDLTLVSISEDGTVSGLYEQFDALLVLKPYLFESEVEVITPDVSIGTGSNPAPVVDDSLNGLKVNTAGNGFRLTY